MQVRYGLRTTDDVRELEQLFHCVVVAVAANLSQGEEEEEAVGAALDPRPPPEHRDFLIGHALLELAQPAGGW